jgi:anti-sigma factor RsiW
MTSPANDTSELTAYALGELQAHQATEIHRLLSECPAATSELEQIEAVTDALRQYAPIPQERLNPEQRHAVLRPTAIPRRMAPMQPRQPVRKPSSFWPVMGTVLKAAAVITVTGFAYWLGRQTDLSSSSSVVAEVEKKATPAKAEAAHKAEVVVAAPKPKPAAVLVKTEPAAPVVAEVKVVPAPKTPEKAPVTVIAPSHAPASKLEVVVAAAKTTPPAPGVPVAVTRPNAELAFVSTGKQEIDQFAIRPADIRPAPVKVNPKELMASPAPIQAPKAAADAKPRTAAELYIHAWRSEVASCPWNPATRLLRVTIQLPPSQPAADSASTFPLQVAFDRRYVREFRRLCERHTAAAEMTTSGTQTVWYEFQPVSDEAIRTGRPVATVTLEKGRFTMPSVGPFDGSKLAVLDRGASWQAAREDFLFESAVVGFGMLLRGDHRSPVLNHTLVLALAEKAKGSDASGERARFIREVGHARQAAGL